MHATPNASTNNGSHTQATLRSTRLNHHLLCICLSRFNATDALSLFLFLYSLQPFLPVLLFITRSMLIHRTPACVLSSALTPSIVFVMILLLKFNWNQINVFWRFTLSRANRLFRIVNLITYAINIHEQKCPHSNLMEQSICATMDWRAKSEGTMSFENCQKLISKWLDSDEIKSKTFADTENHVVQLKSTVIRTTALHSSIEN